METSSREFLERLLRTPSPSGYERPVQDLIRQWASRFADQVTTDRHGNVIAVRNPNGQPRVMLAGHCDQIGLLVQYIDDRGFLYLQPIGGWDMQILLGQVLTVWTDKGPVTGVLSRKAPHLLTPEERKKVPEFHEVWLDIGVNSRAEAEQLVRIGDPVTIALDVRPLRNGLLAAPGLDDKVGVWVVMETLRRLALEDVQAAIFCVSTVQEEIGLRGATTSSYGIHPTIGIAVDVTHATDTPGNERKQIGDVTLGKGPVLVRGPNVNPRVFERLEAVARDLDIPVQYRAHPRGTGTDANVIQLSREGVATGLIGIPNRYMHSPVELVSLADLDAAAALLTAFCRSISPLDDWTP
ncbi:MAG: M42 family metallopeptidase [Gemmatales bacterium]|nr:M42 family metallopeptidase [Gemmatales bacterium]MDW7995769.1 M42 family metallopeptidase [Gemmatales bacterium]